MRLSETEKDFIRRHRIRINLDGTDWRKQPHVTDVDLIEMSAWKSREIAPPRWSYDPWTCMWRNRDWQETA